MIKKETAIHKIKSFNQKHIIESSDEDIVTAIHLTNAHGLEHNAAKDQSLRCANEDSIEGWLYD